MVHEDMRKCVAFVYAKKSGDLRIAGTAFWVGYPVPGHPDNDQGLMITANHVIEGVRSFGDDGTVWLRINTKGGGSDYLPTPADTWYQTDATVDVAFHPWKHPEDKDFDYRAWSLSKAVATEENIIREQIGIGDEVFTVGLFSNHIGLDAIEPIIRVGNVAAIPKDLVNSEFGMMKGILVEARSIRGLSGSPVFVHLGWTRFRDQHVVQAGIDRPFSLPRCYARTLVGHARTSRSGQRR